MPYQHAETTMSVHCLDDQNMIIKLNLESDANAVMKRMRNMQRYGNDQVIRHPYAFSNTLLSG